MLTGPKMVNVTSPVTQMPIFHRRGGILVTAITTKAAPVTTTATGTATATAAAAPQGWEESQLLNTAAQQWDELCLEAFPAFFETDASTSDAPTSHRSFFDTKQQTQHPPELGVECRTDFTMSTRADAVGNHTITLHITASSDAHASCKADRRWVGRIHLMSGQRMSTLSVTGTADDEQAERTAVAIAPRPYTAEDAGRSTIPLGGAPAHGAGQVIEVRLEHRGDRTTVVLGVEALDSALHVAGAVSYK
jgi:hypothetical protein